MIRQLLLAFLLCIPLVARAQFATGPIASGAGGAGRAAVDPSEIGLLNPAAVAHLNTFYAAGHFGFGSDERDGSLRQYGVLLADGTEGNAFPGMVSYTRRILEPPGGPTRTQSDINIAIAEFGGERLAFGLGAHRQTDALSTGGDYEQYNGHIGLLVTPFEFLGVGVVAYDFLPLNDAAPSVVQTIPTFAVGLNFIYEKILRARLDFVRPDKQNFSRRTNIMAGVDTYFRPDFAFRIGALCSETTDQTFFTTGLGYHGPRLSFDYSFQKDVRVADSGRHLFDLWLPF